MKTRLAALDGVLAHVLTDLHDAEIQLQGILPRLWAMAQQQVLAETLREFLHESTRQAVMVSGMIETLGESAPERPWQGMRATIAETEQLLAGVEGGNLSTTDLLLISSCLRIKALKIAAYSTARSLAEKGRHTAMAQLLEDILAQEMQGELALMEFAHGTLFTLGMAHL